MATGRRYSLADESTILAMRTAAKAAREEKGRLAREANSQQQPGLPAYISPRAFFVRLAAYRPCYAQYSAVLDLDLVFEYLL